MSSAAGSMDSEKNDNIPMHWAGAANPNYHFVNNSMPLSSTNAKKHMIRGRVPQANNQFANRLNYTQVGIDGNFGSHPKDGLLATSSQLFVSNH